MPLSSDVDIKTLAKNIGEVSGAVIEGVCQKAGLLALRRKTKSKSDSVNVEKKDFEEALRGIKK